MTGMAPEVGIRGTDFDVSNVVNRKLNVVAARDERTSFGPHTPGLTEVG